MSAAVVGLVGGLAGAVVGALGTMLLFNLQVSETRRSAYIDRLDALLGVLADLEASVQAWYTAHRLSEATRSGVHDEKVGTAKGEQITSIFRLRVLAAGVDGMAGYAEQIAQRCEDMTSQPSQATRAAYTQCRDDLARCLATTIRAATDAPISVTDRLVGRFRPPRALSPSVEAGV